MQSLQLQVCNLILTLFDFRLDRRIMEFVVNYETGSSSVPSNCLAEICEKVFSGFDFDGMADVCLQLCGSTGSAQSGALQYAAFTVFARHHYQVVELLDALTSDQRRTLPIEEEELYMGFAAKLEVLRKVLEYNFELGSSSYEVANQTLQELASVSASVQVSIGHPVIYEDRTAKPPTKWAAQVVGLTVAGGIHGCDVKWLWQAQDGVPEAPEGDNDDDDDEIKNAKVTESKPAAQNVLRKDLRAVKCSACKIEQDVFHCLTCGIDVCTVCVDFCHKGHSMQYIGVQLLACACGSASGCECIARPTVTTGCLKVYATPQNTLRQLGAHEVVGEMLLALQGKRTAASEAAATFETNMKDSVRKEEYAAEFDELNEDGSDPDELSLAVLRTSVVEEAQPGSKSSHSLSIPLHCAPEIRF
eukprot:COSAG06_NODE_2811_length_6246_cov_1.872295_4_plen_417_part_00